MAVYGFKVTRLRIQRRSHFGKELVSRIAGRAEGGRAYAADGAAAARGAVRRILVVANLKVDGIDRKAERVGGNGQNRGPRSGADVLRSHLDLDRAVRMDR